MWVGNNRALSQLLLPFLFLHFSLDGRLLGLGRAHIDPPFFVSLLSRPLLFGTMVTFVAVLRDELVAGSTQQLDDTLQLPQALYPSLLAISLFLRTHAATS